VTGRMNDRPTSPMILVAAAIPIVVLLVLRILAPSDVFDNVQPGPMAHTVDGVIAG